VPDGPPELHPAALPLDFGADVDVTGAELRELATQVGCPILAIASQNREQGGYGEGTGRANLDSLKESGDLAYLADVAMFLIGSKNRPATSPSFPSPDPAPALSAKACRCPSCAWREASNSPLMHPNTP